MSVDIPKLAVVLGSVTPPQGDVIEARVHLGTTKEVSSWELLLQNWNKKYSPGGTYPIIIGQDGYICIGRASNVPQIITTRTESIKYESSPNENYLRVAGRCWGEKLFRRVVTKTYASQKGEAIVKDLMDSFAGISHNRSGTELVEDTDTTFTLLEYENTPVWDILRAIAAASDKAGVIGYDFRVAPDGKFEFFQRLSKTSPVSLTDKIEVSEYCKDIFRVRNRITIYGYADRALPADKDSWTESLTGWIALNGTLSLDSGEFKVGIYSVMCSSGAGAAPRRCRFYRIFSAENCKSGKLKVWYGSWTYQAGNWDWQIVRLYAPDSSNYFQANLPYDNVVYWRLADLLLGPNNEYDVNENPNGAWTKVGNPDWKNIAGIEFDVQHKTTTEDMPIRIDGLFFEALRYRSMQEDSNSIGYPRDFVDTDEELYSDNECMLRAKAILAQLKDPAEYLTVRSTVIDYGTTPLLPGDRILVVLPNENVDSYFCILTVEYIVDAKAQTLKITMELGREVPLLADYLYALRSKSDHMSRHKIARMI